MIGQIKNSVFTKVLWGFMGLFLLNISVDPADLHTYENYENLTFNDQESIVEIVIEKILGYENAITEFDDPDTEDHTFKVNPKINFFAERIADSTIRWSHYEATRPDFPSYSSQLAIGFQQLDTPPPRI